MSTANIVNLSSSAQPFIVVTGATGLLGESIVRELLTRVRADRVGVSVRDSGTASALADLGVRVRQGNFEDPESLRHAFEGASQLLLVSSNAMAYGGDTLAQHRTAIAAARAAGIGRIVYTSHMAASASSAFPPMRSHAATEEMLQQSGIPWTALRHGFYAASGIAMLGDALQTGELAAPADGRFSWTAHADLAEAAAIILANEGCYDGPTPPLTGSQALDLSDMTAIASELLHKPVQRLTLTDGEMRDKLAARGTPPGVIDMILGLYLAARNGEFAAVDPALEKLLGRPPITMRTLIAQKIDHP
ncbi:MAG: NAD(P)-dependent oxidoreductase [Akkermansiaceae bacterium]|nr:NAD(P)-dependent oxidoreductase [Akkermansiaceae bacterium]